jgi:hypothetical protein
MLLDLFVFHCHTSSIHLLHKPLYNTLHSIRDVCAYEVSCCVKWKGTSISHFQTCSYYTRYRHSPITSPRWTRFTPNALFIQSPPPQLQDSFKLQTASEPGNHHPPVRLHPRLLNTLSTRRALLDRHSSLAPSKT